MLGGLWRSLTGDGGPTAGRVAIGLFSTACGVVGVALWAAAVPNLYETTVAFSGAESVARWGQTLYRLGGAVYNHPALATLIAAIYVCLGIVVSISSREETWDLWLFFAASVAPIVLGVALIAALQEGLAAGVSVGR